VSSEEFDRLLELVKALAHESRLKLLGILAAGECTVEELAAKLRLKAPMVSHHLTTLRTAGLVTVRSEGNLRWYHLDGAALGTLRRGFAGPRQVASIVDEAELGSFERKVLQAFVGEDEQITDLPASPKKRLVLYEWLVEKIERGRRYPERELNEILLRHHWDSATIRREMVGAKLLARTKAGVYWRPGTAE